MNAPETLDDNTTGMVTAETGTVAVLNKSEIDMQIATARKYPRSIKRFRDEALQMVTLNEVIAGECFYALPRKQRDPQTNKQVDVLIEGPSARFGEIIFSAWGNSRTGARVVSDQGDFVTAQGVFHDLQNNAAITYEVQRRITNKNGTRFSADMIGVTANAACSIALRNAILKGVPKAFWSDLYVAARQCAMGDFKTLGNRRKDVLADLQKFGISPAQACARLEVPGIEDIGLEHLLTLRGLLTALRDGDTTPEQAFGGDDGGGAPGVTMTPEQRAKWEEESRKGVKASRAYFWSLPENVRNGVTEEVKVAMRALADKADAERGGQAPATAPAPAPTAAAAEAPAPAPAAPADDDFVAVLDAAEKAGAAQ